MKLTRAFLKSNAFDLLMVFILLCLVFAGIVIAVIIAAFFGVGLLTFLGVM